MNYGKNQSPEAEFSDIPYRNDGQESTCLIYQSPVCSTDHNMCGRWMRRNRRFSGEL